MRSFLEFCREKKAPLDFVTRHAYGTEEGEADGHYVYQKLRPPSGFLAEPQQSRAIIDSFAEFKGMEMHITEFNTSYSPTNPIHDTNLNAAYIARVLSELGDTCASYSYWTFGDVFEEAGVAFTLFSGCFGLLANGNIPKPTYWAFVFYKDLYETGVGRGEHFVVTKSLDGNLRGIAWNHLEEGGEVSLGLSFDVDEGTYLLLTKTVDEVSCNPLKAWLDMGSPANPTARQLALLKECARPLVATQQLEIEEGVATVALTLAPAALCFFELAAVSPEMDRGSQPERIPGAV
jgi:xylan 1,4-beta-xylosidase